MIFYAAFVGISFARGHSWGTALLTALVIEAIFVAAVFVFVGVIVLVATKAAPRR